MGYALRMALRQFRLQPAFAAIVVLVLGLGTGAATAVYTIVDSVVLRPLPYRAPDRLVKLWDTNTEKGLAHNPFSPVTFMDYRALPVFEDAAAWWRPDLNLRDPGLDPVRVKAIETSANLFQVLGTGTQLGEGFPKDGPFFSRTRIAVISDRLWRTRYAADPSVVGRVLQLDNTPYTVVGIMPAGFHFPDDIDVWQRLQWDLTQHSRNAHFMEGVARLKDGVAIEQARAAADTLAARLGQQFEGSNKGWAIAAIPLLHDPPARLLPAGALRAVRRRRPAVRHRLPQRRLAPAHARARPRARDRRAYRDRRGAAAHRRAAARRERDPVRRRAPSSDCWSRWSPSRWSSRSRR